ncbi:DsbA family oxidoreductase [Pseudomonas sp.]|jgi:predicted DsbA family dithiol-disulfide isomerase|uniref:DsbA family oxidoreductase n=1 Tax=Pseudomonas sp. TaxID=306 RepID=UPI0028A7536D|nr:DsbA family oxidoreductase [Pseudomonas sp.]
MSLTIRIASDFICPWCYIGERRLQHAIARLPAGTEVVLQWLPYELNPEMRPEGAARKAYRSAKFGSWERSQAMDAQTVLASSGDGLAFDYGAIEKTPNTFLAHRLVWLAQRYGQATPMAQALLSAYFAQGRDIGAPLVLTEIAVENGLPRAEVEAFLSGDEGRSAVREAEQALQLAGVRGVPYFDIEGEVVTGAQSAEALHEALVRALNKTTATH